MNHCDEMTGLLYLDGQLDDSRADEVRSHAATCAECRERLRGLQMESVWLCESLQAEEESLPQRLLQPPRRGIAPWGWVPVVGLGAGGAYTVWSGFIVPWRAQAALAGFTQGNLLTMFFFTGAFWKGWDAMAEMTEFLAMATLGLLAMWLLWRHQRRLSTAVTVAGVMAVALAFSASSRAAEIERGHPSYTLPAGAEAKTDLIVFAGTTRIDGDVDGDLIVWSRDVTVNGHVKGDILSWGEILRVNGPVDGNVRAAAGALTLNSTVAKNVMAAAHEVDLENGASVGGTVTLGAADVALGGRVGGDLLAFTGDTDINGSLGHNVEIRSRSLTIGPQAQIEGETKYVGRQQAVVSPSAKLGTPLDTTIRKNSPGRMFAPPSYWRQIWRAILKWGASFLFGMSFFLLMPGFFSDISRACRRIMPALGLGALFLFATPIIAAIVCATIVGLGVGITTLLLWGIVVYAAHTFVGAWLGERVLPAGTGAGLGGLAVGLLILQAIGMVPFLGGWISFVVVIWGIGALVLAAHRKLQPQQTPGS
jgi:cytoskeletal protein CcmA (bactofilin family)